MLFWGGEQVPRSTRFTGLHTSLGESLLCLSEQKHLRGWSDPSCLELPGTKQTASALRAHGQVAQRSGSGVMGEGCGFAGHKGVVTEDLGTGPVMWWPLE